MRAPAKAPSKAAMARRITRARNAWKAAKPALDVYEAWPGAWALCLNGLETKSEMNQRGSHWPSTNRKAAQRKRVAEAFLVLRLKAARALTPPRRVVLTRFGGKELDRLVNLPSAFKAIEDEVCAQFGVDDGAGCPIAFACAQRPGPGAFGVEIVLEWAEAPEKASGG